MNNFLTLKRLQVTGSRRSALDLARGRLVLISAVFVLAYIAVAARVVDLSLIQGAIHSGEKDSYHLTAKPADYKRRADIIDRNGVLLARSLETASLYADPAMVEDAAVVAGDLAEMFPDLSYGDLLQKLQRGRRFAWIKRNLTPEEQHAVLYLGHPGLGFQKEDERIYPQGELAAHMVGYTSVDGQGLAGIEGSFDKLLAESDGALALTLDVRLQHALRREIQTAITDHQAKAGAGIIMDVTNGEILAAVSLPDFDPHQVSNAGPDQLFNRVSLGVYELGSTFKIFSTAALLESGVSVEEKFDVREPLKVGRFQISDYHPEKRVLTLPEVFIHSSNIGSALMGQAVGTKALKNFYKDLGFMKAAPLEIKEVGEPLIPNPWREVNTLTASFGHGIAVSPLHLVSAVAGITNGGMAVNPTLILDQNSHKKTTKKSEIRIVSPQTAHRMRQLLRLTVTHGTGTKADIRGYNVGGKTGTAEKIGPKGYERRKLLSSFMGVFPMDAPRYAVYIMVDEPKGTKKSFGYATGGWVAAPAVGRVIESMVAILGIKPDSDIIHDELTASLVGYIKTKEEIEKEKQIASH